jgi:hypothetical protein
MEQEKEEALFAGDYKKISELAKSKSPQAENTDPSTSSG